MTSNILDLAQEIKSSVKWIITGVAVFGIGLSIQKVWQRYISKDDGRKQIKRYQSLQSPRQDKLGIQKSRYSEFYFDKEQEMHQIAMELPQIATVDQIYQKSPQIVKDQFLKYTQQMRKRRRLIRKVNEDQYVAMIFAYQRQVQELLTRSRIELLERLQIGPEQFVSMEENYQSLEDLKELHKESEVILNRKLITDSNQKKISNEKLIQILNEEAHFIKSRMYSRLKAKLQKDNVVQSEILMVVNTLLEDIIYDKFGYEVEDVERKIEQINFDTSKRDQLRRKMEADIGDFAEQNFSNENDGGNKQTFNRNSYTEQSKQDVKMLDNSKQ